MSDGQNNFSEKECSQKKIVDICFFFFFGGWGAGGVGENTIKDIKCKHMRETPCSTRSMT